MPELNAGTQRCNIWRLAIAQALAGANSVVAYASGGTRRRKRFLGWTAAAEFFLRHVHAQLVDQCAGIVPDW